MNQAQFDRMCLIRDRDLRSGIDDAQLILQYQPLVASGNRGLAGVEALVRWQHPGRGLLSPDAFLPAMERNNLMADMTDWVVDEALRQCAVWRSAGRLVPISINLSATMLDDDGLIDRIMTRLDDHCLPAHLLTVEITETALPHRPDSAAAIFTELRSHGVRISVDDFGTGYTSLAMFKHYTFDQIKIDRSFVTNMRRSPTDTAIVGSVVDLGHRLGLEVAAEGIEDEPTARLAEELGCDLLQGFHLARPVSGSEVDADFAGLLRRRAGSKIITS